MSPSSCDVLSALERLEVERCTIWRDADSGLIAVLVIDDVTLGPASGGIRTRCYPDLVAALTDAAALARSMTLKCALGGLDAGGCKIVVLDHDRLDRPRAFARLGERVTELGGLVRTAGDLGTSDADLEAAAARCRYVHLGEGALGASVARGLLGCVRACAARRARAAGGDASTADLSGLRVGVQGAGSIGAAVARALGEVGARVWLSDLDAGRARAVASRCDGQVLAPEALLGADVDVLCPCAAGGVITPEVAARMRAWAVVPGANGALDGPEAERRLLARGILSVPDVISSAGAVIDGIGRTVMGLADRTGLVDALAGAAGRVLDVARQGDELPSAVAERVARERIARARRA